TGLRRERDAAPASLLDLVRNRGGEGTHPRRGQRNVHPQLVREPIQLVEDDRQLLVVGGGEREKRHLVPSRVHDPTLDFLDHLIGALLAKRTIHVSGQAEAAPPRTTAHHLHPETVVG